MPVTGALCSARSGKHPRGAWHSLTFCKAMMARLVSTAQTVTCRAY